MLWQRTQRSRTVGKEEKKTSSCIIFRQVQFYSQLQMNLYKQSIGLVESERANCHTLVSVVWMPQRISTWPVVFLFGMYSVCQVRLDKYSRLLKWTPKSKHVRHNAEWRTDTHTNRHKPKINVSNSVASQTIRFGMQTSPNDIYTTLSIHIPTKVYIQLMGWKANQKRVVFYLFVGQMYSSSIYFVQLNNE